MYPSEGCPWLLGFKVEEFSACSSFYPITIASHPGHSLQLWYWVGKIQWAGLSQLCHLLAVGASISSLGFWVYFFICRRGCIGDLLHVMTCVEHPALSNVRCSLCHLFIPLGLAQVVQRICRQLLGRASSWKKGRITSHFLHIVFLLMHSDVRLAFLGSKCYPADSLPTSSSSCSAPENGMGWKGLEIILSGEVFKGTGTPCGC
jgi:hypothetical protein